MSIKTNLTSSIGKEPEERPIVVTIGKRRKDGKYPVTWNYPGAPNMFGGHYPDRVYRKLHSETALDEMIKPYHKVVNYSLGSYQVKDMRGR